MAKRTQQDKNILETLKKARAYVLNGNNMFAIGQLTLAITLLNSKEVDRQVKLKCLSGKKKSKV